MRFRFLKLNAEKTWTILIMSLLFLAFYYLSYRYPLQYNSSTTSPTYSDTPILFQIAKYGVFLGIMYFFFLLFMAQKTPIIFSKKCLIEFSFIVYLVFYAIFMSAVTKNNYLFQTGLFISVVLLYHLFPFSSLQYSKIVKFVRLFINLAIVFEIYQLINYMAFDRLPALGYYNSYTVRFGSIWDDPNSFALLIPFMIAFISTGTYGRFQKIILISLLLIMLLLTQSLTGLFSVIVSFPIGIIILFLFDNRKKYLKSLLNVSLFYGFIVFLLWVFMDQLNILKTLFTEKQTSINSHLSGFDYLSSVGVRAYLGFNLSPLGKYAESGYVNLMLNFGIVFLIIYILIGLFTIIRLAIFIKNNYEKTNIHLFYAVFYFVLSFYIGMINLPIDTVFPLNLLLAVCIVLSYTKYLPKNKNDVNN